MPKPNTSDITKYRSIEKLIVYETGDHTFSEKHDRKIVWDTCFAR